MYNLDTDFLYPSRVTPELRECRGEIWTRLIDFITGKLSSDLEKTGFTLMMVRLGRCVDCDADSFRASQGCTQCAKQMIRRFKGSDEDFEGLFKTAIKDLEKFQKSKRTTGET
jgi:hypothetical protein